MEERGLLRQCLGLLQQLMQLGNLLAKLVALVLQTTQLIATDLHVQGLGWACWHKGSHLHTSQLAVSGVSVDAPSGRDSEFFFRSWELFCLLRSRRSSMKPSAIGLD